MTIRFVTDIARRGFRGTWDVGQEKLMRRTEEVNIEKDAVAI